jgi:hypothetical protein
MFKERCDDRFTRFLARDDGRKQQLFLLTKVWDRRRVEEGQERRCASRRVRAVGGPPQTARRDQRVVVIVRQRDQSRMAFHSANVAASCGCAASSLVKPNRRTRGQDMRCGSCDAQEMRALTHRRCIARRHTRSNGERGDERCGGAKNRRAAKHDFLSVRQRSASSCAAWVRYVLRRMQLRGLTLEDVVAQTEQSVVASLILRTAA